MDQDIASRHKVSYESTFAERVLALLVELGEFANETRCFKYWSEKPPSPKERILDEYADALHFFLSLGVMLGAEEYTHHFHVREKDASKAIMDSLFTGPWCEGDGNRFRMIFDEIIGESKETKDGDRFAEVERIEAMSPEEKFAFFQKELSKCIRCNACRNVCPACSCRKCVFDSNKFDSAQKANVDSFEEKMFHIIRAFHVAGRCTDCGECSRVCPQGIPLHLFNRKFIKDIDELYGEYQAGADLEERGPLTSYQLDDAEPGIVAERS